MSIFDLPKSKFLAWKISELEKKFPNSFKNFSETLNNLIFRKTFFFEKFFFLFVVLLTVYFYLFLGGS